MARRVTIQHLPGCPNLALALERVTTALERLGAPTPELSIEEIADADEAARRNFVGSPTILVDGIDPFRAPGTTPAFACRTYRTEIGTEGAPSVRQLLGPLAAARGSGSCADRRRLTSPP